MLKSLVPETVKLLASNPDAQNLSVLLNEKDLKALEQNFHAALKQHIAGGIEIKADKNLSAGFRIGTENGAAYYDFSAEAVAQMFASYLNPRTAQILKSAATSLREENR